MKKILLRSLMVASIATVIISCSKEEGTVVPDTKMAAKEASIPYELSFTDYRSEFALGNDSPNSIFFPMPPDNPWEWPYYTFTRIETPTSEYLKETCLFDISKLEDNKTYTRIKNGKLTIGFFNNPSDDAHTRLLKLKSSAETGWTSKWGTSPNIESENPDILYTRVSRDELVIYLSQPCIEFGFEFAPNHKNYDHLLTAAYGDWIFDNAKGGVSNLKAKSPSGARLIAVKATKPFTMITIRNGDSPTGDPEAAGFGIANIRYRLAK
jgi:hypothetical protein